MLPCCVLCVPRTTKTAQAMPGVLSSSTFLLSTEGARPCAEAPQTMEAEPGGTGAPRTRAVRCTLVFSAQVPEQMMPQALQRPAEPGCLWLSQVQAERAEGERDGGGGARAGRQRAARAHPGAARLPGGRHAAGRPAGGGLCGGARGGAPRAGPAAVRRAAGAPRAAWRAWPLAVRVLCACLRAPMASWGGSRMWPAEAAVSWEFRKAAATMQIGGMALHEGKVAEMRTGEGKTLSAVLPAYLNALSGRGVHLITVNEYLAVRDCEWCGADAAPPRSAPARLRLGWHAGAVPSCCAACEHLWALL